MYIISTEKEFCASHQLRNYDGPCARLHGHNWKVRIEVQTKQLNNAGMAMDFVDLDKIVWNVIGKMDHQHLNDIQPFDELNPTAENVARYIFENVMQQLPAEMTLKHVDIWENEQYKVSYAPQI